jgi:ribokinase
MRLDAAGCGSMVVDHFYRTPRIIGPDEKILLDPGSSGPQSMVGGVVLNHLGWARVLGLRVGVFGKIGDDPNGRLLRDGMRRLGIRTHLTTDGAASAFAVILLDRNGDRSIYMSRGATGELTPAEIEQQHQPFIRTAAIITTEISQLPLRTVIAILKVARTAGLVSILDVDVPPSVATATLGSSAQLERALRLATILKPAKAAARELAADTTTSLDSARAIRERFGSRAVLLTEGDQGCTVATQDDALRIPAFRVKQVDSTGAGDAFMGGVIAGLQWGWEWRRIGLLANAAGAVCVTQIGAFPSDFEPRSSIERLFGEPLPRPFRQ